MIDQPIFNLPQKTKSTKNNYNSAYCNVKFTTLIVHYKALRKIINKLLVHTIKN